MDRLQLERARGEQLRAEQLRAAQGRIDLQPPYLADSGEPTYLPLVLSVGTGFKFGCGFMLAIGVTALCVFLVLSLVFFVASLVGVPLPF